MHRTTIDDLRYKEIINLQNGHRLGYVCDAEVTLPQGQIVALIVPGESRFFGLLGREEDRIIPWEAISKIGEDIILVDMMSEVPRSTYRRDRPGGKKRGFFF